MELSTAVGLIEKGIDREAKNQVWSDLGAGQGLFTRALSLLLPDGGTIYAVDHSEAALKKIVVEKKIMLHRVHADFTLHSNDLPLMDGILMANALHYVPDKTDFVRNALKKLKPGGRFLLVEYDLKTANPWVPFPISKSVLNNLSTEAGFGSVSFLGEVPSVYNRSTIYSAVLMR